MFLCHEIIIVQRYTIFQSKFNDPLIGKDYITISLLLLEKVDARWCMKIILMKFQKDDASVAKVSKIYIHGSISCGVLLTFEKNTELYTISEQTNI